MSEEILNKNKPNKATALEALMPDGGWWGEANGNFFCDEGLTLPAEKEILAKLKELEDEYEKQAYARARADAYPSWQDQMDLLYHGGVDALKAELKKTKDKYPKPT